MTTLGQDIARLLENSKDPVIPVPRALLEQAFKACPVAEQIPYKVGDILAHTIFQQGRLEEVKRAVSGGIALRINFGSPVGIKELEYTFARSKLTKVSSRASVLPAALSDLNDAVTTSKAFEVKPAFIDTTPPWRVGCPAGVVFDAVQVSAILAALKGKSLFITGPGGVGKSEVVRQIIRSLRARNINVRTCASTGMAAVANDGTTIHSLLGTGLSSSWAEARRYASGDAMVKARDRFAGVKCVVIDEISMLTGDYIDMMDRWLRKALRSRLPFGGLQIIFVGDFLQLPPVITRGQDVEHTYAFQSPAWKGLDPVVYHFEKSYRTDNAELIKMLNRVRMGKVSSKVLDYFNGSLKHTSEDPTGLRGTNADAEKINNKKLAEIEGECKASKAIFGGYPDAQERLAKQAPCPAVLNYKAGALVLLTRNHRGGLYVNGDRGHIESNNGDGIKVKLFNGTKVTVARETFKLLDGNGNESATMSQYPMRLGWAVTVHKSQGLSLASFTFDPTGMFEKGQAYVALSRARSFAGMQMTKALKREHIKTSALCRKYYESLPPNPLVEEPEVPEAVKVALRYTSGPPGVPITVPICACAPNAHKWVEVSKPLNNRGGMHTDKCSVCGATDTYDTSD